MSLIQKSHRSMYMQQYYEANRETILLKRKQYYNENKSEIKDYKKEYYQDNKNIVAIACSVYQRENRESINKQKRPLNKIAYYKRTYELNQFDNDYIKELINIKDNQNIKNKSINYIITLKEFYDLQI